MAFLVRPSPQTAAADNSASPSTLGHALRRELQGHPYLKQAHVVDQPGSLDEGIQAFMLKRGMDPHAVKGVFTQGQAFVIASNVSDVADGIKTALHEVVGHLGVRALLGDRFEPVMLNAYQSFPRQHEAWQTTEQRYGYLDTGTDAGKIAFAEELTAHLAETASEIGEFHMIQAEIRAKLREQIPDLPVTDMELLALIQRSRESLILRHGQPSEAAEIQERQARRSKAAGLLMERRAASGKGTPDAFSMRLYREGNQVLDAEGLPCRLYHGAGSDVSTVEGPFWGSPDPDFANEYAALRTEQGASASVVPYYADLRRPFNGDPLKGIRSSYETPDGLTVAVFIEEVIRQSGVTPDQAEELRAKGRHLRQCGRREESGPSYSAHDFWYMTRSMFGAEGAETLQSIYRLAGFDGVRYTELGKLTYGVFNRAQLHFLDQGASPRGLQTDRGHGQGLLAKQAFSRWFGSSKVVDDSGQPLVVYHGTTEDFSEFSEEWMGSSGYTLDFGDGFYFSNRPDAASTYAVGHGANVMPVYLMITNPAGIDVLQQEDVQQALDDEMGFTELADVLGAKGYDGIAIDREGGTEYVVFRPEQIKSALTNTGAFDPNSPDIRFSFAGKTADTADLLKLTHAKARLAKGDPAEEVRQQTGWFQGSDNRWRFEISDRAAALLPPFSEVDDRTRWGSVYDTAYLAKMKASFQGLRLKDVVHHPRLFAAYPALKELNVTDVPGSAIDGPLAQLFNGDGTEPASIRINRDLPLSEVVTNLLHEAQHRIQFLEGFAEGGSVRNLGQLGPENAQRARETQQQLQRIKNKALDDARQLVASSRSSASVTAAVTKWTNILGTYSDDNPFGVTPEKAVQFALLEEDSLYQRLLARFQQEEKVGRLLPIEAYARLAGEVEARNVQARRHYRDQDRLEVSPFDSQDIPNQDVIVVLNGEEIPSASIANHETADNAGAAKGQRLSSYLSDTSSSEQLTISFDEWETLGQVDPYKEMAQRPGTRESQRERGRQGLALLIQGLSDRINRRASTPGSTGMGLLAASIPRHFVAGEPFQLLGTNVSSAADLAQLAQVYRNPHFETLRIIMVRDGKVVGETALTSRLPATVNAGNLNVEGDLRAAMDKSGANGYYLAHNHPSGSSAPSAADVAFTERMWWKVPGFLGHVIIDHNEYSVIDALRETQTVAAPWLVSEDFSLAPTQPHPVLGRKLTNLREVVEATKQLNANVDDSVLISTHPDGSVSLVTTLPNAYLSHIKAHRHDNDKTVIKEALAGLRSLQRAGGTGGHHFLVTSDEAAYREHEWLMDTGLFANVISVNGHGAKEERIAQAARRSIDFAEGDDSELDQQAVDALNNQALEEITRIIESLNNPISPIEQLTTTTYQEALLPVSRPFEERQEADLRLSFAGVSAQTMDAVSLENAQQAIAGGINPEIVRQETGWFRGVDHQWRFEIDDSQAKVRATLKTLARGAVGETDIVAFEYRSVADGRYHLTLTPKDASNTTDFIHLVDIDRTVLAALLPEGVVAAIDSGEGVDEWQGVLPDVGLTVRQPFTFRGVAALALDEVLEHPDLFAAYPELSNVWVSVDPRLQGEARVALRDDGVESYYMVTVGPYQQATCLLHEIQHIVQAIEGFAPGGSTRDKTLPTEREILAQEAEPFNVQIAAIQASPEFNAWIAQRQEEAGTYISPRTGTETPVNSSGIRLDAEERFGISALITQRSETLLALSSEGGFLNDRLLAYHRLAGEAEARNVQARQGLDAAQRRLMSPESTQDVPYEKQIVRPPSMPLSQSVGPVSSARPSLMENPSFTDWFRNSRVVDGQGQPLVVYKGMFPYDWRTESNDGVYVDEITEINRGAPFPAFNGEEPGLDNIAGFFGDRDIANHFAAYSSLSGAVFPVYLSLQRPYEVDAMGAPSGTVQFGESGLAFRKAMRSGEYDGAIIYNTQDEGTVYVTTRPEQVKSTFNVGTFNPDEPDFRLSFAGESARTADRLTLDYAKRALSAGIPPSLVREHTGWEQGNDGRWRFEIDDSAARMATLTTSSSNPDAYIDWIEEAGSRERGVPLSQVLHHPELFEAYPILLSCRVKVVERAELGGSTAAFDRDNRELKMIDPFDMRMREDGLDPALLVILHELQHGIQDIEAFAQGGRPSEVGAVMDAANFEDTVDRHDALLASPEAQENSHRFEALRAEWQGRTDIPQAVVEELEALKKAPVARALASLQNQAIRMVKDRQFGGTAYSREELFDGYRRLTGEVEARNVQTRAMLTGAERQQTPPVTSEDIPRDKQLLVDREGRFFRAPAAPLLPTLASVDAATGTVHNETQSGAVLQEAAAEMLDLLAPYGLTTGWMDGGCRIFVEALGNWSKGKIQLGVTSRDGLQASHAVGVLALGEAPDAPCVLLDGDGLASPTELMDKLEQLEKSQGERMVAINDQAKPWYKSLPYDAGIAQRASTFLNLLVGSFPEWENSLRAEIQDKAPACLMASQQLDKETPAPLHNNPLGRSPGAG